MPIPSRRRPLGPWCSRRSTEALLTAAVLGALSASARAQTRFEELRERYLPASRDVTPAVALGDVDRDGDLDLVAGNDGSQNRLYLGDGAGHFVDDTAARMPADADATRAVAFADVDGDGDLDLVCGNGSFGNRSRLYLNDGSGRFVDVTETRMPVDSDNTWAITLGDVDGDGDLDLFLANGRIFPTNSGQDRLYLNDGTGTFTDVTVQKLPTDTAQAGGAALGDVDRDGDLDLVVGNWASLYGSQNRLYVNDGTGTFTDVTATALPVDQDETLAIALADVDVDGDLDLLCANGSQNRLYLNDGSGRFSDATGGRLPTSSEYSEGVAFADLDRDGDLDFVVANSRENRLYRNDGTGVFVEAAAALPPDRDNSRGIALGDVDGDGDLDAVFGNGDFTSPQQNTLYLNDGSATFVDAIGSPLPRDHESTSSLALGDVDGDGDLDLVAGTHDRTKNRFHRNDGRGRFDDETATAMPPSTERTEAIVLGDVDGDGDLDVVAGDGDYGPAQNRLYLNDDGAGRFADLTNTRMPILRDRTHAVALGDVDADGDLDLITGNGGYYSPEQNRLYVNAGGTFLDATIGRMPVRGDYTHAALSGDVDGDGDLDIFFGNIYGRQNLLYLNDGTSTFTDVTATKLPADRSSTYAAAFGDVDGDGDLDLVCANTGQNRLYLNDDGRGRFADLTAMKMPIDNDVSRAVVLGDVDEDGDLDLVFGNRTQNRLYVNDGKGGFSDATPTFLPPDGTRTVALALGDVDGDSDLDLIVGNEYSTSDRLESNLRRHLGAPQLALLNRSYVLDVYSRTGAVGSSAPAYPFLATRAASIPFPPFGTLGLDPSLLLALPPLAIPQSTGVASVSFTIPPVPAIVGLPLLSQALIVTGSTSRLTNVTLDVLLR